MRIGRGWCTIRWILGRLLRAVRGAGGQAGARARRRPGQARAGRGRRGRQLEESAEDLLRGDGEQIVFRRLQDRTGNHFNGDYFILPSRSLPLFLPFSLSHSLSPSFFTSHIVTA